jgi:hypothetical protein
MFLRFKSDRCHLNAACRLGLMLLLLLPVLAGCGDDDDDDSDRQANVVSAAGDITASVNQYRAALGEPNNGGTPGPLAGGRREINWDGVPDAQSAPNFLPGDFFRGRGSLFDAPGGSGVQVSADSNNPAGAAVRFGNINPTYTSSFQVFSAERLFAPIGTNIVDVTFTVPGTQTPAVVRGFGAVFTDVDGNSSSSEYFDKNGRSLGRFVVPAANNGLSFLGVAFSDPIVARVRIVHGNSALGPDDSATVDVVVVDDFIYGEPQASVP